MLDHGAHAGQNLIGPTHIARRYPLCVSILLQGIQSFAFVLRHLHSWVTPSE